MKTGIQAIDESTARFVLGTDECGFGSWAGPLYVAGAVVPQNWVGPKDLTDSKGLTPKERERIAAEFYAHSDDRGDHRYLWVIKYADSTEIDTEGVWHALHRLHRECIEYLSEAVKTLWECEPLIVVDGTMDIGVPNAISLKQADVLVPAVSMASVIGKVEHDRVMREADLLYPGFDFATAVGYHTPKHREKLMTDGPCPIHRRSYDPVIRAIKAREAIKMNDLSQGLEEEENPGWNP